MTDTESFDALTKDIGGLYRTGSLPVALERKVLELFNWLVPHVEVTLSEANCNFRPCFGMIHNREFNAIAFRNELGTACVGVYSGAFQALNGLFNKILSNNQILIPIGQPNLELNLPNLPSDYLDTLTDPSYQYLAPSCPVRRTWADDCTKQALRFLIRHELVHVAHGHVDYLAAQQGTPFLVELGWTNFTDAGMFERQVLEFDADCCAASWWCGVFLERYFKSLGCADPRTIPDTQIDTEVVPDLAIAFFQWSFSVSALFRLFGDAGFDGANLTTGHYPPLRLRQTVVLRTVIDHVRERWNSYLSEKIAPAVWNGLDVAEASIELVTGSARQVQGLRDAFGPTGNDHVNVILEYWDNHLRQKLLPFSLGGYLPRK